MKLTKKLFCSQWSRFFIPLLILLIFIILFDVSIWNKLNEETHTKSSSSTECEWYYNKDWWSSFKNASSHSSKYHLFPLEEEYNSSIPFCNSEELNSSLHTQHNPRWNSDNEIAANCSFDGKIFSIGLQKTGTSSIANALQMIGYECNKYDTSNIIKTCNTHPPSIGYKNHLRFHRSWRPFAADDICEAFASSKYKKKLYLSSIVSSVFADAPWAFLFKLMDEWHPNSKFIYTLRASTYQRVNSALKFELRTRYLMKHKNKTTKSKFIKWNSTLANMIMPMHKIKEFALLMARQYEKHHRNVLKYFGKSRIGKDRDVLILCIECEQNPWQQIGHFLGCQQSIGNNVKFPHKLSAVDWMPKYFLPRNFSLNWNEFDQYEYGKVANNVLNIIYNDRFSAKQRMMNISKYLWRFDVEKQRDLTREEIRQSVLNDNN